MIIHFPALIDLHVHLREPGQTYKGDIAHESAAAYAGGFGCILAMANTTPAIDRPERFEEQLKRIAAAAHPGVQVLQCAAMTIDRAGKEPVDAAALKKAGCLALSDDGSTPRDTGVMREVSDRALEAGLPLIDHCETPENTRRGELELVERDILLSQETGCAFHLQHLSCAESVEMLRQAKGDGIHVTGEATPHHLTLTEDALRRWGTHAKMSPPLRTDTDREALIAGLIDGTIDVIATDHAPHAPQEKALPFDQAPNGIIGLEAAFPVCYTQLVATGLMSIEELLKRMTTAPAAIIGITPPKRMVTAELLKNSLPIETRAWHSRAANSPWEGTPVLLRILE